MARHDRLHPQAVVAAGQAVHLKRRRGPNPSHDLRGILRAQRLKSIGLLEALDLEP